MFHNHSQFLERLPATQSPTRTTEKYMFLDTRKVIADMADLGFEVADARFPRARTKEGHYGLHEVDFRKPQDIAKPADVTPRILFLNSYDGSRKAMFAAGVFRLACYNGLVIGDLLHHRQKIMHIGDYEEALLKEMREMAQTHTRTFDRIERFREIELDPGVYLQMAEEAAKLRFPDAELAPHINPGDLLQVRRPEDQGTDLWTRWNVLQENLLKGGVPVVNQKGATRLSPPVGNIDRSNELNRGLWDLAEKYAEAA